MSDVGRCLVHSCVCSVVSYLGFERILARLPRPHLASVRRRLGLLSILAELLQSSPKGFLADADANDPFSLNIDSLISSYSLDTSVRDDRCALVWLLTLSQKSPRHWIASSCVDGESQALPLKWIKWPPKHGVVELEFALHEDEPSLAKSTSVAYAPGY